jgi:hypothetical protein
MHMSVMTVAMLMMFVAMVMDVSRVIVLVRMIAVVVRFAGRASQVVARDIVVVGMFVHLLYSTHHKDVAPSWQLTMQLGQLRLAIRPM